MAAVVLTAGAIAVATAACGSDPDSSGTPSAGGDVGAQSSSTFQKIRPGGHMYSIEEMVAAGFKKSKEYDVTGLDHATAAF